jgi:tyrosyl-DNA phosphodiesterase 2
MVPTVLMLQEVSEDSLPAILAHAWVRDNFILSDKTAPQWYFTLLLVSKTLATERWFRVPFVGSGMGRDALFVDIQFSSPLPDGGGDVRIAASEAEDGPKKQEKKKVLRVCTTHLESLSEREGFEKRPKQLGLISRLLKGAREGWEEGEDDPSGSVEVIAGFVGGDMNSISDLDNACHRRSEIELKDVWEENVTSAEINAEHKAYLSQEEDSTFGRLQGHTWGYQPRQRWPPKRMDKFFYTGIEGRELEFMALEETKGDASGKLARLGVGLKTEWGQWVSDHFGIAVDVKVL